MSSVTSTPEPLRLLLTGGTGYLGSHFIHRIITDSTAASSSQPIEILYTHNIQSALVLPASLPAHVTITSQQIDLTLPVAVTRLITSFKPHIILHTAAYCNTSLCEKNPSVAQAVNVDATRNIVQGMKSLCTENNQQHKCHLIFISTDWVFSEDATLVYSATKLAAEACVREELVTTTDSATVAATTSTNNNNISYTILRSALMYGEPSPLTGKHSFIKFMLDGLRTEKGVELFSDELRSPIPVSYVIDVVLRIVEEQRSTTSSLSTAASSSSQAASSSSSTSPAATSISSSTSSSSKGRIFSMGGTERLSRYDMGQIMTRVLQVPASRATPITLEAAGLAKSRPKDLCMDSEELYRWMKDEGPRKFEQEMERIVRAMEITATSK